MYQKSDITFQIQKIIDDIWYMFHHHNNKPDCNVGITDCWLVSDTHFNHKKIQEYCGRPIGWQNIIISNWNKTIGKDDVVLHLGDFAFGNKAQMYDITKQLNGKIYMIKGNHDRHSKSWYKDTGIIIIPSFMININGTDKTLYFTHRQIKEKDFYGVNIHGHMHQKGGYIKIVDEGVFVNMSMEQVQYMPVKLSKVLNQIEEKYNV